MSWALLPFPVPAGYEAIGPDGQRETIPAGADPWAAVERLNAAAARWPWEET